ncbi:MAG TPA: DUF4124 domain-containing protein [Guyparkeria sp.]|nr:DUF4124 domain-containing protein [Guyparkeria sp.]
MQSRHIIAILAAALAVGSVQAAVYKCEGPDGELTFSDRPCPGQPTEEIAIDYLEPTDAQRLQAAETAVSYARLEQERAMQARHDRIAAIEQRVRRLQKARDRELAVLRARKRYAANNLAGATWLQSINQEMDTVTRKYAGEIEAARNQAQALREAARDQAQALREAEAE